MWVTCRATFGGRPGPRCGTGGCPSAWPASPSSDISCCPSQSAHKAIHWLRQPVCACRLSEKLSSVCDLEVTNAIPQQGHRSLTLCCPTITHQGVANTQCPFSGPSLQMTRWIIFDFQQAGAKSGSSPDSGCQARPRGPCGCGRSRTHR